MENTTVVCGEITFTGEKKEISLSKKLCRHNHEQEYEQVHSTSKSLFKVYYREKILLKGNIVKRLNVMEQIKKKKKKERQKVNLQR